MKFDKHEWDVTSIFHSTNWTVEIFAQCSRCESHHSKTFDINKIPDWKNNDFVDWVNNKSRSCDEICDEMLAKAVIES